MKTSTKVLLIISHILIPLFSIWGVFLTRALIARPDLPGSAFWHLHVIFWVSLVVLFVLPFLLGMNLRWYRIIGLICYLILSMFWYPMIESTVGNLILVISDGELLEVLDFGLVFYLICIAFYIYPIITIINSFIQLKRSKDSIENETE